MSNDFARCVLRHPDGRWLYHLPNAGRGDTIAVLADGQPMTRVADRSPWWAADHEATRITQVSPSPRKITGYKLDDPAMESAKHPAELTIQEWDERRAKNNGLISDLLWDLYSSVGVDQDPIEEHIDGPFTVLEGGEPPAPGGPKWTVNLLDSITQRPEYGHLFPGHIEGLASHIHGLIEKMPRVRYNFNGRQGKPSGLYVTLALPFEKPVTEWRTQTNLRTGKALKNSGRNVQVTVTRELHLPVPDRLAGENYADALAQWDAQVEFWTGLVTEASVAACNHCNGTGHIPAGAEKYETKR